MASFNKSLLAFRDLPDIFQRALDSEKGIKITCKNHAEAMSLRTRLHYYRRKDKERNALTYPPDHILHSASVWDALICKVPPRGTSEDNVLRIVPRTIDHLIIEPIEPETPKES